MSGFFEYDICWCANSHDCKRKDCFRHLSNRPKVEGTDIFTMGELRYTELCPLSKETEIERSL